MSNCKNFINGAVKPNNDNNNKQTVNQLFYSFYSKIALQVTSNVAKMLVANVYHRDAVAKIPDMVRHSFYN